MGRLDALETLFNLYAQRCAVAQPEPAEVGADTGFAGAESLGVGVARRHTHLAPHVREVLLGDAQQIDALAAGYFHHLGFVFLGSVGDAAQFVRRGDAAVDAWHHAERAVLLDVGVNPIVDEASVALVLIVGAPYGSQQRCQAQLAAGVFLATGQRLEHC